MVPRSQALWRDARGDEQPALIQGLLTEAGRLLDRLDKLDAQLTGRQDEWLRVDTDAEGDLVLIVDKALGEARALAVAYTRLVTELRQLGVVAADEGDGPARGGDLVDDLLARRARESA